MESLSPSEQRLLDTLRREAERRGAPSPRGVHVDMDMTQGDIPSILRMSRPEATRVLGSLKRKGYIAMEGSTIILLKAEA